MIYIVDLLLGSSFSILCLGFKLMETIILYFEGTKKASLN